MYNYPYLNSPQIYIGKNIGTSVNEDCWFSNKGSKDNYTVDFLLIGFGKSEIPHLGHCISAIIGKYKWKIISPQANILNKSYAKQYESIKYSYEYIYNSNIFP